MSQAIVAGAVRTAIGTFGGALKDVPPQQLGAKVIQSAAERAQLPLAKVDEVILGMIYQGGQGSNPARQAAVHAGVPYEVPSMGINKMCGSGLRAITLAAAATNSGESDVVIAGGMESMSQVPYALLSARWGVRIGHGEITDLMILDGLWDCFYDCHMGITAENLAEEYDIPRQDQDAFALQSQERYAAAQQRGLFDEEIVPVHIPQRKGDPEVVFDVDEHPRKDTSLERLGQLEAAFKKGGTVTAGNASGINDGAAAVVVMSDAEAERLGIEPLATIVDWVSVGVDPRIMGIGPAPAIRALLKRATLDLTDIDLIEVNEAFAAQTLAVGKDLGWDEERVNVNGGAIALGHPVGASGARIAITLIHGMQRRGAKRGIAALCIGGGMGIAALFERP